MTRLALRPYALAFAEPVRTARGVFVRRRGWWVRLEDDAGRVGWGEAAPWPGFGAGTERVAAALRALTAGAPAVDVPSVDAPALLAWAAPHAAAPEVRAALECAALDLAAQRAGVPLAALLWDAPAAAVATHALVTGPRDALIAASAGARTLKIKLGTGSVDDDVALVAAVRSAVGASVSLRLDANRAWSAGDAVRALERLAVFEPELVEEPLAAPDLEVLAALRHETGVPIALDETLVDEAALAAALDAGAFDVAVVKPTFVGGLTAARALIARARAAGLGVVVTHALGSAVERAAALHLAAGVPGVHGLGGALEGDRFEPPTQRGDIIEVPSAPGLGLVTNAARAVTAAHPPPSAAGGLSDARAAGAYAIPNPLAGAALARPGAAALFELGPHGPQPALTWGALRDRVLATAGDLYADGVRAGEVVAVAAAPSADFAVAVHALGWLGAAVALLPAQGPPAERVALLRALHPDRLLDVVNGASPAHRAPGPAQPERFWPLDEVRFVLATSGSSTGTPRRVELRTGQLVFSALGAALRLGHHLDDRWLCCLPLHHVGGLSILLRATWAAVPVELTSGFVPAQVAARLASGEVTLVSLVPEMLRRVLDVPGFVPHPRLRAVLLGGAAAPPGLVREAEARGLPLAVTWGMSETASQVCTRSPEDAANSSLLGDVGAPLAFARVDLEAEGGPDARLVVRGPVAPDGRLVTGDRGRVDEAGRVEVLGRADAVIVSGGENIDPAELVAVFEAHPAVAEAAVVALDDARWGQRPGAVLVAAAGVEPDEALTDDVRAFALARLARFKVPEHIVWTLALPRTGMAKPATRELRALLGADDSVGPDQPEALEPLDQARHGAPRALEGLHVGEGVDEPHPRPHDPVVGAAHLVSEGYAARRQARDPHLHGEARPGADGALVIRLGVHQRHPDLGAEPRLGAPEDRGQQLLEGPVAVLVDPTEEDDPGGIYLVETRRRVMNEGHGNEHL